MTSFTETSRCLTAFLFVWVATAAITQTEAQSYEKVCDFTEILDPANANKGSFPRAKLIQGRDGNFYGTTSLGALGIDPFQVDSGFGTVFRMTPEGSLTTLVEFTDNGSVNKGKGPTAALVQGSDGNLYGTTSWGGAHGDGTIFKMTMSGILTTIVEFDDEGTSNKGRLVKDLVLGHDGNFYGMTVLGGSNDDGTIFKMTPAGSVTTLVEFGNYGVAQPTALIQGQDGNLYGTTFAGGAVGRGAVFKVNTNGALTILTEFVGDSNIGPISLLQGSDGNFYGTTNFGGGFGSVFKMTASGSLTTLVQFSGGNLGNKGRIPIGLVEGNDGNFYGVNNGGEFIGTLFKLTPQGVLTTLVVFNEQEGPAAALTQGLDGDFYGTTSSGGLGTASAFSGYGTVFRLTPEGTFTTLVEFTRDGVSNRGKNPVAALNSDDQGNFFGTTRNGGIDIIAGVRFANHGTVFKLTSTGGLTTQVKFTGNDSSNKGSLPQTALIRGANGNFYGTTSSGGIGTGQFGGGYGTVFEMTPSGTLTTLVQFTRNGENNRGNAPSSLLKASDGSFYGTTAYGGIGTMSDHTDTGNGTVFRMTPAGVLTTLVEFTGNEASNKGAQPSTLVQSDDNTFYGTTAAGGANGYGTVFKMTQGGALTTLVEFTGTGGANKGIAPVGLVRASDGSFYGSTNAGGEFDHGTIFRMTPGGTLTTLVDFTENGTSNKGKQPSALLQALDGGFYGTTASGGSSGFGTVFKMSPEGILTTLIDFPTEAVGKPSSALIMTADGNLYGTTNGQDGTIYRIVMPGPPTLLLSKFARRNELDAFVEAHVNARGTIADVSFDYGTDGVTFPFSVPMALNLNGNLTRIVGTTVTGLSSGTTYFYRLRATSTAGTTYDPPLNKPPAKFSTLAPPEVTVNPASEIRATSARFAGAINARNFETTAVFEWGIDGISFPNTQSADPRTVEGNSPILVNAAVAGLPQGGTVFYRLRAANEGGTAVSGVRSFSTVSVNTVALANNDIGIREVTFRATINTFGQMASVKFKYWADSAPETILETATQTIVSNGPKEVSAPVTGLLENVNYSYRVSVELAGTETDGDPVPFKTRQNSDPEAVPDPLFYSGQVRFNPLENDEDEGVLGGVNGNLTIATQLVQGPTDSGSSAVVSQDGKSITYTPGNDSAGRDTLVYRALDPYGGEDEGTVTLTDFFLLSGYYSGMIDVAQGEGRKPAVALFLSSTGAVSTSCLDFDGERYPLKGVFGTNGRLAGTFAKKNMPNASFSLTFQLAPPAVVDGRLEKIIKATFQEILNGVPSPEVLFELKEGSVGGLPAGGTFTAFIKGSELRPVSDVEPGQVTEPVSVPGDGFLVMRIGHDKYRRARVAGRLPDNEPFTSGTLPPFGRSYQLANTRLYRKNAGGAFGGQIHVIESANANETVATAPVGILGDLTWRRRASLRSPSFAKGIASRVPVDGLLYPLPDRLGLPRVLGFPSTTGRATLTLTGLDLKAPSLNQIQQAVDLTITAPNAIQVVGNNPYKVKVKANAQTALFSGSFIHPTTRKTVKFNGAFQAPSGTASALGQGCFLSGSLSGSVKIAPHVAP